MTARVDILDPAYTKLVDLGVVAGKVTVRSCPVAKNITVHTRTYAATNELLNTMQVEEIHGAMGEFRLSVLAPSFDWHHCQHSFIEVVVPEGAKLDVNVHGVLADVEIEASENALRHVTVATKVARIRAHNIETEGDVALTTDVGYVAVQNVATTGTIKTRQIVGYLRAKEVSAGALDSELTYGCTCAGNLNTSSVGFLSTVAWVNMWNVEARVLNAYVEYGKLSVSPQRDFAGSFSTVSPYGFLDASSAHAVTFNYSMNNEAAIAGFVDGVDARKFNMASIYGAVKFFVMEPSHEKKHHHE